MGKRQRARQRALGLRKQPSETKKQHAKHVLRDLTAMDQELRSVIPRQVV